MKGIDMKKMVLIIVSAAVIIAATLFGMYGGKSAGSLGSAQFTVVDEGEEYEYDLSSVWEDEALGAMDYAGSYATNVNADPDFRSHISVALGSIRTEIARYATVWSIIPPLVAILLALITKEVYSSLFIGILVGGLIYAGGNFETAMVHIFSDGFVGSLADSYNVGILVFLVMLGAMVSMMNRAGGSAAFGRWASNHIKTRVGAQLATMLLGVLIFVDDYFNCLTVGSVMRPITDRHKISRAKLAYLIDATAAPVCIIAPISSWAAAVSGFAKGAGAESGMSLFISAIPYNFYALLTLIMIILISSMKFDFGPMKLNEDNAMKGDIFTVKDNLSEQGTAALTNTKGRVMDLVIPVIFLIIACVIGMIYSGGFYEVGGDSFHNFIDAFSNSDASVGLLYGSFISVIFTIVFYCIRRVISFKECMECIPEGFKAMVPAIMILTCAWTLKTMTDSLGAKIFISQLVEGSAGALQSMLPAIIFLIAVALSFATGTSWGTFGILIPIVLSVFGAQNGAITVISISACMAGAVCGDHCSPISDTTIMASAGAGSNHVNHVSTQLPYALSVAAVSFVGYIVAGFTRNWFISFGLSLILLVAMLFVIKKRTSKE